MKKLLITLLLAVLSTSAIAEWVPINDSDISTYYVDPATIRKAGNKVIDINASKQHYTVVAPDGRATKTNFTPSGVKHETLGYITPGDSADADVVPAEKNPRGRPTGSKSGTLWNKKTTK